MLVHQSFAACVFNPFCSPRLLFHELAIMWFFSDFFRFRTRQRKKDEAARKERERRWYGSRACGKAPTTERTIYDVSPRNTLISNVSHRSSYLHLGLSWSWRNRIETLFAARIVRLAGTSVRKPMLTRGGLLWIYEIPQIQSVSSIENKLEQNRSRRYRGETNGTIRKNFLDEWALMGMILFSYTNM